MEISRNIKKQRPIPPADTHVARCYMIADLGTHMKSFNNALPKPITLIHFGWELPQVPFAIFDETKGPQPHAVFQEYTKSIDSRAGLIKMLASWRRVSVESMTKVNLKEYLGQACFIGVQHQESKDMPLPPHESLNGDGRVIYAKVGTILPLPKSLPPAPALINKPVLFDMAAFDWNIFLQLPAWMQKRIKESLEWPAIVQKYGPGPSTESSPLSQSQPISQSRPQQQYVPSNGYMPKGEADDDIPF